MERIVFENKLVSSQKQTATDPSEENNTNYAKIQEALYKKFNHSTLNKMRLPVKLNLNSMAMKTTPDDASESFLERIGSKTERISRAEIKTQADFDVTASNNIFLKLQAKSSRKAAEPKKFNFSGQSWNLVPSEKWKLVEKNEYGEEANVETKIAHVQLSEQEEQRYMTMLNKNIRNTRPLTGASTARSCRGSQDYTDIDSFFQRQITSRIDRSQDQKSRPEDFSRYSQFE